MGVLVRAEEEAGGAERQRGETDGTLVVGEKEPTWVVGKIMTNMGERFLERAIDEAASKFKKQVDDFLVLFSHAKRRNNFILLKKNDIINFIKQFN